MNLIDAALPLRVKSIPNRLRNSGLWDGKAKMDPKKLTNVNAILDGSQSYWARPAFLKL